MLIIETSKSVLGLIEEIKRRAIVATILVCDADTAKDGGDSAFVAQRSILLHGTTIEIDSFLDQTKASVNNTQVIQDPSTNRGRGRGRG